LFFRIIDGLIDSLFIKEIESQALGFLREVSTGLFERELDRFMASNPGRKAQLSPFMSDYMDALPAAFLERPHGDTKAGRRLVALLLQDLRDRAKEGDPQRRTKATAQLITYQASRIQSWCWDETWRKKMAGCRAIGLLISNDLDLGSFWPHSREMDMIRGLMSILKDMPSDPPLDVDDVVTTILGLIRFCNPKSISNSEPKTEDTKMEDTTGDTEMNPETTEEQMHDWVGKKPIEKARYYLILMSGDLSSVNKHVREAAQKAFQLLAELLGLSTSELLKPHIQSIVSHIFSKPLRALPVPRQIGNISAITYLLGLNPPVLEPTEELIRLLGETQALADNEDVSHFIGRPHYRRHYKQAIDLRVACITLLTASLQVTDYFAQQVVLRQRYETQWIRSCM
jgi:transformation/transcription domain-associated protein